MRFLLLALFAFGGTMPLISEFSECFGGTELDAGVWTEGEILGQGSTVVADGKLALTISDFDADDFYAVRRYATVESFDFTGGGSVILELTAESGLTADIEFAFLYFGITGAGWSGLYLGRNATDLIVAPENGSAIVLDWGVHRFWRLAHDGVETFTIDSSIDGLTWVNRSTRAGSAVPNGTLYLEADYSFNTETEPAAVFSIEGINCFSTPQEAIIARSDDGINNWAIVATLTDEALIHGFESGNGWLLAYGQVRIEGVIHPAYFATQDGVTWLGPFLVDFEVDFTYPVA